MDLNQQLFQVLVQEHSTVKVEFHPLRDILTQSYDEVQHLSLEEMLFEPFKNTIMISDETNRKKTNTSISSIDSISGYNDLMDLDNRLNISV
jgi:hypothetical protein